MRVITVDNNITNSDWTKANAFDFPDLRTVEDFEQQFNIPSDEPARSERLANLAKLPWARVAPAPVRELLFGKSLVDVIKASFGGNRSEAGRYAANIRWQGRGKVPDITEELKSYFGENREEYKKSEGFKEVKRRELINESSSKDTEDYQLEIIAEKQGFTGKPKVVTAQEMDELEKQGWTIAYRGIGDGSAIDKTKLKSEDLAKEFIEGDYYAGFGVFANGTYMSTNRRTAESYADQTDSKGTVLKIAIPPKSLMQDTEFYALINEIRDGVDGKVKEIFYGSKDFGRFLCAKGKRGFVNTETVTPEGTFSVVIFDRSMLAVQELDTQK